MSISEQIIAAVTDELVRRESGIERHIIDLMGISIDVLCFNYAIMATVSCLDGVLSVNAKWMGGTPDIRLWLPYRAAWELCCEPEAVALTAAAVLKLYHGRNPR